MSHGTGSGASAADSFGNAADAVGDELRVLVIAGSLRRGAYSRMLANEAIRLAPESVDAELFEQLAAVPPFDEDLESGPAPDGVRALQRAVHSAHGVFVVTPEYNGSIPGQLKNAFDWLSRSDTSGEPGLPGSPMFGRPVAVASSSTGQFGGVWAADELRKVLRTQGARVVGTTKVAVATAHDAFDEQGHLVGASHIEALRALLDELVASARELQAAGVELVSN